MWQSISFGDGDSYVILVNNNTSIFIDCLLCARHCAKCHRKIISLDP